MQKVFTHEYPVLLQMICISVTEGERRLTATQQCARLVYCKPEDTLLQRSLSQALYVGCTYCKSLGEDGEQSTEDPHSDSMCREAGTKIQWFGITHTWALIAISVTPVALSNLLSSLVFDFLIHEMRMILRIQ